VKEWKKFMKILLAVDGSSCGLAAVRAIADRPWPAGSEIKIISVVEVHLAPPPGSMLVPDSHYLKLLTGYQRVARDAVGNAETLLRASNASRKDPIEISTEIINGNAKEVILDEAGNWGADLIVLGSHGYRAMKRLWLGSVSLAVAAHAHCSVEIVRCPDAD
jgi:nucleotide-binding universal stress UspA family protein